MRNSADWLSSAPIVNLLKHAAILSQIRRFFSDRKLIKVEVPATS